MAQQSREHGTLTLIIDNATEYFKTARGWSDHKRTGNVTLCGSEWYLMADRVTKDGVAWLDVGICCDRATNDAYWCKGTFIFRIRSSGPDDFTRRRCIELCDEIGELITIEDLLKPSNGYLKDGKITIECRITVTLPANNEAVDGLRGVKRRCTDVKIVMGDRHIYANRGALAVHCGYFDAAFNGGFAAAKKDEIRLDDVNADDFVEFLKVVYRGAVHASNVAAVAPLADRFHAREILQECESVLVNDVRPCRALPILEKCGGLDDLKKELVEGLSLQDLKELTAADMLSQFCKETVVHLLNAYKRRFDNQRT